jgi:hypothetical protein
LAARDKTVADAFARVVVCASYCNRWITDYDFARIIACEHVLACEHDLASDDTFVFDVVIVNKALYPVTW